MGERIRAFCCNGDADGAFLSAVRFSAITLPEPKIGISRDNLAGRKFRRVSQSTDPKRGRFPWSADRRERAAFLRRAKTCCTSAPARRRLKSSIDIMTKRSFRCSVMTTGSRAATALTSPRFLSRSTVVKRRMADFPKKSIIYRYDWLFKNRAAFLCGPCRIGSKAANPSDAAMTLDKSPSFVPKSCAILRRESLPEKSERTPAMPALVAGGTSRALTAVERATGLQAAALVDKSNA